MVLEELLEEEEEDGEAIGTVLGMVPVLDLDDPGVFKLEFVVGVAEYPWALLRESGSHSPFFWVGMVDFMGTGLLEEEVDDLRGVVDFLFSSMLSLKNSEKSVLDLTFFQEKSAFSLILFWTEDQQCLKIWQNVSS